MLFSKRKKELPQLISDEELDAVDYNQVLEWLVGLSKDDYKKVCNVANIYREADQAAAAELGIANEPTSSINPPMSEVPELTGSFLDDDEPAFLNDIKQPKGKGKGKK